MKFLFDLFPIILFFVAFKLAGIYVATGVAIAATIVQIAWVWLRHRKVEPMLWLSLFIVVVFGGATLWLRDETFIKWKPTVLYWMFGTILAGSQLLFRKNLIRAAMAAQIGLPERIWTQLNLLWVVFFAAMGTLNLWVAYRFDTALWVNFKLFGTMGLMMLFVLLQGLWVSRHTIEQ